MNWSGHANIQLAYRLFGPGFKYRTVHVHRLVLECAVRVCPKAFYDHYENMPIQMY